jgi:hypothetical protein
MATAMHQQKNNGNFVHERTLQHYNQEATTNSKEQQNAMLTPF